MIRLSGSEYFHIEEALRECDGSEIQDVIDWLIEDGTIPPALIHLTKRCSSTDQLWNEQIQKLINNRHKLTVDEENIVMNITDKL